MSDADMLFRWANDPETRTWSKSTHELSREDHQQWMMLNVLTGYPTHWVMVAQSGDVPVGVVRFDMVGRDVMSYQVSITIGSEYRGHGLGFPVLDHACKMMHESELFADIRSDNKRSRKIFERCGFEQLSCGTGFIEYRREPL